MTLFKTVNTTSKTYFYHDDAFTYNRSKESCTKNHKGNLAVIKDNETLQRIVKNAPNQQYYLLGLRREKKNDSYKWVDGSLFEDPARQIKHYKTITGDCNNVALLVARSTFTAVKCAKELPYLCERDNAKAPTPTVTETQEVTITSNTLIPTTRRRLSTTSSMHQRTKMSESSREIAKNRTTTSTEMQQPKIRSSTTTSTKMQGPSTIKGTTTTVAELHRTNMISSTSGNQVSFPYSALIGGLTAIIVLFLLIIAGLAICKRKRKNSSQIKNKPTTESRIQSTVSNSITGDAFTITSPSSPSQSNYASVENGLQLATFSNAVSSASLPECEETLTKTNAVTYAAIQRKPKTQKLLSASDDATINLVVTTGQKGNEESEETPQCNPGAPTVTYATVHRKEKLKVNKNTSDQGTEAAVVTSKQNIAGNEDLGLSEAAQSNALYSVVNKKKK